MNYLPSDITLAQVRLDRRRFFRQAGLFSLGAAASTLILPSARAEESESKAASQQEYEQSKDTVKQIFTAALIAEDLATTFYYNGLIGNVITDVNLAGAGGTANNITNGNFGNVDYVRAALTEEISHANLFRSLLGIANAAADPVQTFYFPAGTFDTLPAFTGLLNALENAFIGAYLNAIQEFATKATYLRSGNRDREREHDDNDASYAPEQLDYFAKVAASIMGIECEHRVLGRVISNSNPANNLNYEQTDGLNAVYNGPASAVAALTPFLSSSTGPAYSLASALAGQSAVADTTTTGAPPSF